VRYEELGLDRRHNRYWHFAAGGQPGGGRICVELQVSFPYAGLECIAGRFPRVVLHEVALAGDCIASCI
jgi:hypothetical protein